MSKQIIPDAALAQHIAILGKAGSGKTYTAKGIVEHLLHEKRRVCVVDPTGVWYGLRSDSTGTKAGYPVVVFGGKHQDVPLGATHGAAIAEIVGTTDTPAILDTRLMGVGERTRFFTDFAETLLEKNDGPLHLVIDEAHLFAPQGRVADPQSGKMLHAANNLISLGRASGLRIILISQRPAKIHKDSLTQVETLICLRVIAPQDRNAVEDWVGEWAEPKQGAALLASLPSLPTGDGWIWAPELNILKRATFPRIKTYDSSKAPDGVRGKIVLAKIDLPSIQARLATVAKEVVDNDPKRLRARIAELEKGKPDTDAVRKAEEAGYARGLSDGWVQADKKMAVVLKALGALNQAAGLREEVQGSSQPIRVVVKPSVTPPRPSVSCMSAGPSDKSLPQGEKSILCALAQYPEGCSREQITVLTGFKRSTRDAYIQRLRTKGYAEADQNGVKATDEGVAALGDAYQPLPTGEALREYWLDKLPEGESKILGELLATYPSAVDRDGLSEATGFKRSTRDAYIQRMNAKKLVIVEGRGAVRAADTLFRI